MGDRHLDISDKLRDAVLAKVNTSSATADQLGRLREMVELNEQEQSALFGESLAIGIRFVGRASQGLGK